MEEALDEVPPGGLDDLDRGDGHDDGAGDHAHGLQARAPHREARVCAPHVLLRQRYDQLRAFRVS